MSHHLKRLNSEHFRKIQSHPLLLLVIGAIVTSIIVPNFTRQWQDNQKQLELKTALGDEINRAVSDPIVSSRLITANLFELKDWSNSFKNWEISQEMIGSKFEAYFSNNRIRQNWNNLSSAVEELSYYIVGNRFPQQDDPNYDYSVCNRLAHVLKLYTSYPQNNPINIDRNVLTEHNCNQIGRAHV